MIDNNIIKKKLASSWFSLLQQIIYYEFRNIELEFAKITKKKAKKFEEKKWQKSKLKNEGGGTFFLIKQIKNVSF